jgi:hypothetical protein
MLKKYLFILFISLLFFGCLDRPTYLINTLKINQKFNVELYNSCYLLESNTEYTKYCIRFDYNLNSELHYVTVKNDTIVTDFIKYY